MSDNEEVEATKPVTYALNINPFTVTAAQLGSVLMGFGFVVDEVAYNGFPDYLRVLFRKL
jgi:hypothetical protein